MSDEPATNATAPERSDVHIKRGQVWRTVAGEVALIIGRNQKSGRIAGYVYSGRNAIEWFEPQGLVELMQDVFIPGQAPVGQAEDVPELQPVGKFAWDSTSGYRQLPRDFVGDTGATELVRLEDAKHAVLQARAHADRIVASFNALRQETERFKAALDQQAATRPASGHQNAQGE